MMQLGKRLNARDRMANPYIDEQQDPIKRAAADIECLGSRHDRFTQIVIGQAAGLNARNIQRLGELLRKTIAIAGQNGAFQPLADSGSGVQF